MMESMEIKLLPHHIGNFTDFYILDSKGREERLAPTKDYGKPFMLKESNIFYNLLGNPNSTIEVVLSRPDSICFPDKNRCCRRCIDGKLEIDPERLSNDGNYREFMRVTGSLSEIRELLFYPNLKVGENYRQDDFMEAIRDTAEKIRGIYAETHRIPHGGYTPNALGFLSHYDYERILREHFPLVLKFIKEEIFNQIWSRYRNELVCGKIIPDEEIKNLIGTYPWIFSDGPKEIYDKVLQLLK